MERQEMSDGGQAFPVSVVAEIGNDINVRGMSLRDWFAGQILAELAGETSKFIRNAGDRINAGPGYSEATKKIEKEKVLQGEAECTIKFAYLLADMAIEQRNK